MGLLATHSLCILVRDADGHAVLKHNCGFHVRYADKLTLPFSERVCQLGPDMPRDKDGASSS